MMKAATILAIVTAFVLAAGISAAGASAGTMPEYECSNGVDDDFDGAVDYPSDPGCTSRTDSTEFAGEGYGVNENVDDWNPSSLCKTVTKNRHWKTWWGHTQWKYYQRVNWCWNKNGIITSVNRTRWPDIGCCFWQFWGNIGNSCASETCSEQYGRTQATIMTIGQFRFCEAWCAREGDPGLSINIYAGGSYTATAWGG